MINAPLVFRSLHSETSFQISLVLSKQGIWLEREAPFLLDYPFKLLQKASFTVFHAMLHRTFQTPLLLVFYEDPSYVHKPPCKLYPSPPA